VGHGSAPVAVHNPFVTSICGARCSDCSNQIGAAHRCARRIASNACLVVTDPEAGAGCLPASLSVRRVLISACGPPHDCWICSSREIDVPECGACSRSAARQLDCAGARLRAAHAAGGIGRRGQFVDQRGAIRSGQSQRAQRPQRHRECVEDPAAWQKPSDAGRLLHANRFIAVTRDGALRGRVTAHHSRKSRQLKKAAVPPPKPATSQQV
jgi:hypothetical protein